MQPDEIKKWLTEEEWRLYEQAVNTFGVMHRPSDDPVTGKMIKFLKRLAASRELSERRRVLMEKHEFPVPMMAAIPYQRCAECWGSRKYGHTPDCAWDAALRGVGGEELKTGGANEKE